MAVFIIPNANLLDRVVNMIGDIPMEDRDTKGDLYEYMLSKIATAGSRLRQRTFRLRLNSKMSGSSRAM